MVAVVGSAGVMADLMVMTDVKARIVRRAHWRKVGRILAAVLPCSAGRMESQRVVL